MSKLVLSWGETDLLNNHLNEPLLVHEAAHLAEEQIVRRLVDDDANVTGDTQGPKVRITSTIESMKLHAGVGRI